MHTTWKYEVLKINWYVITLSAENDNIKWILKTESGGGNIESMDWQDRFEFVLDI